MANYNIPILWKLPTNEESTRANLESGILYLPDNATATLFRAIAILREITEVDPFCDLTDYGNSDCFYCSEDNPNHSADCPYLLAQQLLEEIDNGRPSTKIP